MILKVKPQDSFLFRTNKPFGVSDNTAQSVFPPYPATLYGAIRSAVIMRNNCLTEFLIGSELTPGLRKQLGTKEHCGEFQLRKYGVMNDDSHFFFPTPRDCMGKAKGDDKISEVKILTRWAEPDKIATKNYNTEIYRTDKGFSYRSNSWIYNLKDYLLGNYKDLKLLSQSEFLVEEAHTGIQVSPNSGTVTDGMLFTQQRLRMKSGFSLFIEYTNLDNLHQIRNLHIGQDRRLFATEMINTDIYADFSSELKSKIQENNGNFKIYFSSPVFLKNGVTSENFDSQTKIWKFSNTLEFTVSTVIGAKPVVIGGWDLARRCPKKIHKFHSAGTVLYCKLNNLSMLDELFLLIDQKNICDDDQLNKQGFGHAFIGVL